MSDDVPMGEWDDDRARTELVDEGRCVWCKYHMDDWDEDTAIGARLDTGEVVCETCLRDIRRYKRSRTFFLHIHGSMTDRQKSVFNEWYEELIQRLRDEFGGDVPLRELEESNATSETEGGA